MDYFDQIDEYLNNTLSESEKIAFEVAMATDAKLRQAVDDHEVAMDVVGSILEGEVRNLIDNEELIIKNKKVEKGNENGEWKIENVVEGEGSKEVKVRRMNWMRWGAAAVVMFVLGWWGMNALKPNLSIEERIHSKFHSPLPSLGVKSGSNSTISLEGKLDSALHFYDEREFAKSKLILEQFEPEVINDTIRIFLADIYFFNKNYKDSQSFLDEMSNEDEFITEMNTLKFFLALIRDDTEHAKSILSKMTERNRNKYDDLLKN